MPALLATKVEAAAQHFINHVLVADGGANDFSPGGFDRSLQAGVAHHGGHECFFYERFLREQVERGDGHDVIAINQPAGFIAEQHPVGVTVVRNADAGLVPDDLAAKILRMHRAAIPVDVHAVGLVAINDDFRAKFAQDAGRGFVGGAVRAVHHHPQAFERQTARKRGLGKFDVTPERVVNAHRLANFTGGRADVFDFAAENEVFDLALNFVVELVAVGSEEFDAVVGVGIVRGGDDDAGVGAQAARDVGDAGRRQRADEEHVHAHRKDAGRDGVFEHVARKARILADDDFVAAVSARLAFEIFENVRGGAAEFQRGFSGDRFNIGRAANAVGAEDFLG